jgi:hypothetical protein
LRSKDHAGGAPAPHERDPIHFWNFRFRAVFSVRLADAFSGLPAGASAPLGLEDVARCAEHRREAAGCWADSVVVDDPLAACRVAVVLAVAAPAEQADRSGDVVVEAVAVEAVRFAADPAEAAVRAPEAGRSGVEAAQIGSRPVAALRDVPSRGVRADWVEDGWAEDDSAPPPADDHFWSPERAG